MVRTLTQGYILVFLRKPIATRHFPEGVRTLCPSSESAYVSEKKVWTPCPPSPLDPPMIQKKTNSFVLLDIKGCYVILFLFYFLLIRLKKP